MSGTTIASLVRDISANLAKLDADVQSAKIREKRGRGRPRVRDREPTMTRHVKLPLPLYDALCRLAYRERVSVHALLLRAARREAARFSGGSKNTEVGRPS